MGNALYVGFLLIMLIGCSAGFVRGVDKQQAHNDRQTIIRCQEGYQSACIAMLKIPQPKE